MSVQLALREDRYRVPTRLRWVGSGKRAMLSVSLMKPLVLCINTQTLPRRAPRSVSEQGEHFQASLVERKRACGQRLFPGWAGGALWERFLQSSASHGLISGCLLLLYLLAPS